ncbi:MAG: hypothetical protein SFY32_11275 [Bacteroidota bacterium]|nr:hypothetical protein [Bacteroidota bacterium]
MDVLIVSKTRMTNAICVGGILADGRSVRLLDEDGHNQPNDTDFEIKDVWTIEFDERLDKRPPHVEDVLLTKKEFKFKLKETTKMLEFIKEKFKSTVWKDGIDNIYGGKIQWTSSGSGYVSEMKDLPDCSTGFWLLDKDLKRSDYAGKVKYKYPFSQWRNIPFVGCQSPIDLIPAGTLVRLSLARWWSPDGSDDEERCYLQLSGWYDFE